MPNSQVVGIRAEQAVGDSMCHRGCNAVNDHFHQEVKDGEATQLFPDQPPSGSDSM